MKKITILINHKNEKNYYLAENIVKFLQNTDAQLFIPDSKPGFDLAACRNIDFSGLDAALVLGGDGTILAASRFLSPFAVPMLGINMGKLGFLSEVEQEDVFTALQALLEDKYYIEERMMLEAYVLRKGQEVASFVALNDLVVNNSAYTRTISIDLILDGQLINSSRSDGIIIATPTGSTAYSFSAGGPLIMPNMELMLLNFVCPHSFFSRPIVVPSSSHVEVVYAGEGEGAKLTADGQLFCPLQNGDVVSVKRLSQNSKLLRFAPLNFFQRVSSKLNKG
ncbi:MAG: NAD(+)/NADH kinase [Bacillota bacterium]|jgi:NAD+ kinase